MFLKSTRREQRPASPNQRLAVQLQLKYRQSRPVTARTSNPVALAPGTRRFPAACGAKAGTSETDHPLKSSRRCLHLHEIAACSLCGGIQIKLYYSCCSACSPGDVHFHVPGRAVSRRMGSQHHHQTSIRFHPLRFFDGYIQRIDHEVSMVPHIVQGSVPIRGQS